MRIITSPTVRIISQPRFTPHPVYQLPLHGFPAENIIATAGKVCYDSYGVDGHPVERHIRNLVDSGHHSVLEHVHVGVFIEGISRGCSHEIVRHRMFNYSQRSTRYTAEDDAAIVLDPYFATIYGRRDRTTYSAVGGDPEERLLDEFVITCQDTLDSYAATVRKLESLNPEGLGGRDLRKWCRGKARQLLPHALETRMVMTGNLRAWRHFFLMRTSRHAEAEIRRLAQQIYFTIGDIAPNVFGDLTAAINVGGFIELTEPHRAA